MSNNINNIIDDLVNNYRVIRQAVQYTPETYQNLPNQSTAYPPRPIPKGTPEIGINRDVYPGSNAVSTSSGIPVDTTIENLISKMPNSSKKGYGKTSNQQPQEEFLNYGRTFNQYPRGETPGQPFIPELEEFIDSQAREQAFREFQEKQAAANTGNWWNNLWQGGKEGFNYSVNNGKHVSRSNSFLWERAPQESYDYLQPEGQAGFFAGRVIGDVIGNGTRQVFWNIHPADFIGTHSHKFLGDDASRMAKVIVPFITVTGLELGSQIYNPFNLVEGGRVAGYQAINPDENDPRISTSPVSDLLIDRGLLGRRGKLLPWEQFREERTDIPYEKYQNYKDYLMNKDENPLRDMTGGLVKGTMDGINGPELSVMGYSLTPNGVLAAGSALLAARALIKSGRIAGLRK